MGLIIKFILEKLLKIAFERCAVTREYAHHLNWHLGMWLDTVLENNEKNKQSEPRPSRI